MAAEKKENSLRCLFEAVKGWGVWHRMVRRKGVTLGTLILILPTDNNIYNYYSLSHMQEFMQRMGYTNAVIFTGTETVRQKVSEVLNEAYEVQCLGEKKMEALLRYASIWNFWSTDQRIRIGSLEHPNGRNQCKRLLGVNGITEEYLIAVGIYRLLPFTHRTLHPKRVDKMSPEAKELVRISRATSGEGSESKKNG